MNSPAVQSTADLAFYTKKNLPQHRRLAVRAEALVRTLAELHANQSATIHQMRSDILILHTDNAKDCKARKAAEAARKDAQHELAQLKKWKAELPALVLDHLTSNDMELLSFMQAADLPMPNQKRTVGITWTEIATNSYSTTDTLDCEWDPYTNEYQPTQDAIRSAKEYHTNYNGPDDTSTDYDHEDDTECDVHDN